MTRALIVGGTGPSGVPIIEAMLARGWDVTIYHRGSHEVDFSQNIEHIHGDPFERESIDRDLDGRKFDIAICTYGRLRHLADSLAGRVGQLVAMTSGAAYKGYRNPAHSGGALPSPLAEDFATYDDKEVDSFGWAVAESERQVMTHHTAGAFRATIFRYPNIYGPRSTVGAIPAIMRRILDGRRAIILPGNGDRLRNRGFVDNLAHAVMLACETDVASGQIYNICDERTLTLAELVKTVARAMNVDVELIHVAHPRVDELCRAYVSEPHHQLFDLSKVKRDLGYRDIVAAPEAVERTTRWLLDAGEHQDSLASAPNSGGFRADPLAYELEDKLIALSRAFDAEVDRSIPVIGRDRIKP